MTSSIKSARRQTVRFVSAIRGLGSAIGVVNVFSLTGPDYYLTNLTNSETCTPSCLVTSSILVDTNSLIIRLSHGSLYVGARTFLISGIISGIICSNSLGNLVFTDPRGASLDRPPCFVIR